MSELLLYRQGVYGAPAIRGREQGVAAGGVQAPAPHQLDHQHHVGALGLSTGWAKRKG